MNPVIKAQLNQFTKTNPTPNFEEQDHFEVFAAHSICNGLLGHDLDPFKVHLQMDEFGIDGIAILIDGTLCIDVDDVADSITNSESPLISFIFLQAKRSEQFDYGAISKFLDGVEGFFTGEMNGESDQLDALIAAKDKIYARPLRRNPNIYAYFTSTGDLQDNTRTSRLLTSRRRSLQKLHLFTESDIQLIGAKELQDSYRQATRSNSATIEFPQCQTLPEHCDVQQAHIGYIKAEELINLVSQDSSTSERRINRSVFVDNIRDYNPSSEINNRIAAQLESDDKASFVFKNNGVTVVSRTINRTGNKFTLDDYQVVNGCQTCNILFQCRNDLEGVFVPLRLIGTNNEEFTSSVIIGTNQQNKIKEEQFWALRPFMKSLEEYCREQPDDRKIYLERREYQYRDETIERKRIVKPSELMKCTAAMYLHEPHRAARDYRAIRREFEKEIFQEGHDVRLYHLACLGGYKYDFIIRNKRVSRSWSIYKYYALHWISYQCSQGKNVFSISKAERGRTVSKIEAVLLDEQIFIKEITEAAKILDRIVKKAAGGAASREKIRDIIRSTACSRQFERAVSKKVVR